MTPALHLDSIAHSVEERIGNLQRALATDDSTAADTARWALRNLVIAREALTELAKFADPVVERLANEGLQVIEDEP